MSFSKTEIFNIALTNLGITAPLQNTNERTPETIILNNYYDLAKDTVLEDHEWSFASAYKNLSTAYEKSPDPNYQYAFTFPNDCIAPRAIINPADNKEKKFLPAVDSAGQKIILTNCNPCILRYTKRITNENFFTASFVNALGFYLAYLSAQGICGSANKKNTNLQDYQIAMRKAIVTDARKTEIKDQDDKTYTDFRY
ncbi:MAG: hypothetical protein NC191_09760 [Muribaculaceae bacterium]|nr:hypothetical protein [Muribaculaceae bacterium]